jgi:hypothetical protein
VKITRGVLLALGMFVMAGGVSAKDDWQFSVSPTLDFAYKKASISMQSGSASTFTNLIQPTYTTFTPAIGASYGPFYALLSYDTTIEDWRSESNGIVVAGFWSNFQDSYRRNEASATLGYRVFRGNNRIGPVSVFGGYLQGTSVWRENVFTGGMSGGGATAVFGTDENTRSYLETGYYLGANYAHSFGDKGTLSLTAAYAFLDGTLNETALLYSNLLGSTYVNTDYTASARGASVGILWMGPITGSLNYRVGMKYVNYSFPITEKRDNLTGIVTPQSGTTISERVYSFFFGLSSYF